MRVALVGLGAIGVGSHLPALLRHPTVELAALVDTSPERRADAAGLLKPTTASLDEVLGDVSGVVLATPPWVTPDLAVQALRAGCFVLAEKPIATSMSAAKVYDVLTPAQRSRLQVGLTYRHDPAIEQLRAWITEGVLGEPLLVRAHIYDERRDPADPTHQARIEETLRHGPPVVHEGAHVFDWLSFLLGAQPDQVEDIWEMRTDPAFASPNLIGARLSYPDNAVAMVEFGWLTNALPRCEISILGPRGHALLDGVTFRLELTTAIGHTATEFAGDHVERCFDRQLQRFVELSTGQRPRPEPDLADGLAALSISERIAMEAR